MQYDKISVYIKNERLKQKVGLNNFAFNCGVEPAILSRIENCKQGIKLATLEKIANGFNKTAEELLIEFEKI
jgi:transcriptional regulator with XRE-family HTH domain